MRAISLPQLDQGRGKSRLPNWGLSFRHLTAGTKRASGSISKKEKVRVRRHNLSRHISGLGTSVARGKNGLGKTPLLVALGLPAWVLLAGVLAVGQTPGNVDTKSQPRTPYKRRTITIDDQVKRFAESLDLSETQQSAVKKILEFRQVQTRRIRFDGSLSGAERISRFRGLQDSTVARIRAVLSDEQKKKYDPLVVRQAQKDFPPAGVADWMKAVGKQKGTEPVKRLDILPVEEGRPMPLHQWTSTQCLSCSPQLEGASIVKRVGDAKRDRVYCATALLDILEEPARLKPAAN